MLFISQRVLQRALSPALFLVLSDLLAQAQHPHPALVKAPDQASTHGLLLFGTTRTYATHLPMFHRPHDYQVVLELALPDSAAHVYRASKEQFPAETVYTLEPEPFVLPELLRQPRPFRATLYRGHFERGGTAIARHITVRIKQVLYAQQLQPKPAHGLAPALLVVGHYPEQFVVHRIASRPDFDQVAELQATGTVGSPEKTEPGVLVLPTAAAKLPVQAQQVLPVQAKGAAPARTLTVGRSLYLEHDDLR